MKTTKRRYEMIDFYKNEKDFLVVYCAGIGLSHKCIQELTGFTLAQVKKRLQKASIKIRAYRSGHTPVSKYILKTNRSVIEKHLMRQLSS